MIEPFSLTAHSGNVWRRCFKNHVPLSFVSDPTRAHASGKNSWFLSNVTAISSIAFCALIRCLLSSAMTGQHQLKPTWDAEGEIQMR
ncbi:hypothetical protein CLOM_g9480 [Closterium sp. NIES-68]|nr:hypothetical protein CLOM_g9480 [Closterium sp. NIES-68]GJP84867.1 hypothetical protein CLOP_g14915 [Closterium sp. NIES-67]